MILIQPQIVLSCFRRVNVRVPQPVHELSIAEALLDRVRRHQPPGTALRVARVRIGPLRGIAPEALLQAWQVLTAGTPLGGARLELELLPWRLTCVACGHTWDSPSPDTPCRCGSDQAIPGGGDELLLVNMDVDEPAIG